MNKNSLIWLLALALMLFATCKSKEKARKVDESRKFDTENMSSVLYSAYLNVNELKAYKLVRNIHLPGIQQTAGDNEVVSVFYKTKDSTDFELSSTNVYAGNLGNLGIPENFGNEMKYWLSFLPNPLLPHTYGEDKIETLKELFTLKEEQDDNRFRLFKLNKEKFNELPESKDPLFENLKDITMVFDTRNNNIREYHFEFESNTSPLKEHIIVFDDYQKEAKFTYPSRITRTSILNERSRNQENSVQEEIVINIQKLEDFRNKRESCGDLSDPGEITKCKRKWDNAMATLSVLNKMMAENIYTVEYDIRIKDVKMK